MSLHSLRQLSVHDSDESSFGVDEGGSFSARDIRCIGQPNAQPDQQVFESPVVRHRVAVQDAPILGLKNNSKLTFSTFLRGTGTAAGDTVAALGAAARTEGQLLKHVFGAETLGTGTTINDASPTTTGFTVTSAAGLAVGQAIMVTVGTVLEATVIKTISTNDLTFTRALSGAPADSATVYASATYYPVEDLTGSLQFRALGSEDMYFHFLGCRCTSFKFSNLNPGQLPQMDFEYGCASWAKKTGGGLAAPTYTSTTNPPIPGYAATLMVGSNGTTTRTVINGSSVSVDSGLAVEKLESVGGVEGVQDWPRSGIKPTVEFTLNPHVDDWFDDYAALTAKSFHYQIGATAGNTVLIEVQKVNIMKVPERAAINSQLGVKVNGEGIEDPANGTAEFARAAIRVHLL
jgi:hypothetical protein